MVLGRSLTKRLKRSVTKTFSLSNNSQNNEFYAINFNEIDTSSEVSTITSKRSNSNISSTKPATTDSHSMNEEISRTSSNSLCSDECLTKIKTPSASKPPSIASSPTVSIPTSHPLTPNCQSPSKSKSPNDFVYHPTISETAIQYESFALKDPPTHRKVLSASSSATSSSCYSSVHSANEQHLVQQSLLFNSFSINRDIEDDIIADEMAMEILDRISAQEYVRELESGNWAL